jgi:hypothetical protein
MSASIVLKLREIAKDRRIFIVINNIYYPIEPSNIVSDEDDEVTIVISNKKQNTDETI